VLGGGFIIGFWSGSEWQFKYLRRCGWFRPLGCRCGSEEETR
jgi:hypothetical protein